MSLSLSSLCCVHVSLSLISYHIHFISFFAFLFRFIICTCALCELYLCYFFMNCLRVVSMYLFNRFLIKQLLYSISIAIWKWDVPCHFMETNTHKNYIWFNYFSIFSSLQRAKFWKVKKGETTIAADVMISQHERRLNIQKSFPFHFSFEENSF